MPRRLQLTQSSLLQAKIVIDMSYPLTYDCRVLYGWNTSGTEQLQKVLPNSRIVGVKSTAWNKPENGEWSDTERIFVTGDDNNAKAQVLLLVATNACQPIDAGGLEENRAIDRIISIG